MSHSLQHRGVSLVSLDSRDPTFEADETSEKCNGEERESKFKRIYFYIIMFVFSICYPKHSCQPQATARLSSAIAFSLGV